VTAAVGIYLFFRPPCWAAAHLFLISILLPLVLWGPLMLRFAISVYLMRFDEFDMQATPYMFQQAHQALVRDFLAYLPPILLYMAILVRIHLRERKKKAGAARD